MEQEHKTKKVSRVQFKILSKYIGEFSRLHNPKSDDCKFILELADKHRDYLPKFQTLCRTSILSFFTLIEADIYYYNLFDKFKEYKDKLNFFEKFEPTFQQICKTWEWPDLLDEYLKNNLQTIKDLRVIRNKLVHPKSLSDMIVPTDETYEQTKNAFDAYDAFIRKIMTNFFVGMDISWDDFNSGKPWF